VAREAKLDLIGAAPVGPLADHAFYDEWLSRGCQAGMTYLEGRRGAIRQDPRELLPSARSAIVAGVLYHTGHPLSIESQDPERGWISRYAWGDDYHEILKNRLKAALLLFEAELNQSFESKICVDTSPLLERSLARQAGLGWIGKNTCLINERQGSWFFLGVALVSLDVESNGPPPARCGSCTRCIDACPTAAIVPTPGGRWEVDSRLCISYWTIEAREEAPPELARRFGHHVFGCDICQDVCPWNRRSPVSLEPEFQPRLWNPPLNQLKQMDEDMFRRQFAGSPVLRSKPAGFQRNVEAVRRNAEP
jgi:epoxyqueuosine reductase